MMWIIIWRFFGKRCRWQTLEWWSWWGPWRLRDSMSKESCLRNCCHESFFSLSPWENSSLVSSVMASCSTTSSAMFLITAEITDARERERERYGLYGSQWWWHIYKQTLQKKNSLVFLNRLKNPNLHGRQQNPTVKAKVSHYFILFFLNVKACFLLVHRDEDRWDHGYFLFIPSFFFFFFCLGGKISRRSRVGKSKWGNVESFCYPW